MLNVIIKFFDIFSEEKSITILYLPLFLFLSDLFKTFSPLTNKAESKGADALVQPEAAIPAKARMEIW